MILELCNDIKELRLSNDSLEIIFNKVINNEINHPYKEDVKKEIKDSVKEDVITVGGFDWCNENEVYNGCELMAFNEASNLINGFRDKRILSKDEYIEFLSNTYYGFDKKLGTGIFCDRKTGNLLYTKANGYRNLQGDVESFNTSGYYWSSTQYDTSNAYYMNFGSRGVNTRSTYKTYGFSVRCVYK